MANMRLQDDQWSKILDFLRNDPHAFVAKNEEDCRRFVEGVLWVIRSGAQWRLLPDEYGKWNTVYKRFACWCDKGVWERMLLHFAFEHLIADRGYAAQEFLDWVIEYGIKPVIPAHGRSRKEREYD